MSRPGRLGLGLALAIACALPARGFELGGAWYVLVHYRDLRSAQPALDQWEDRAFVFERDGDALRFREHPVVHFADERARFVHKGGETERVLGAWEPDATQRAEIARGLRLDADGAREKRLHPTANGWSSARSAFDSARVVGYETIVDVDLSGAAPQIMVVDSMGSSAAHALEGRTLYAGERVEEDGSVSGRFDRDGRRVGTFRMMRMGAQAAPGGPPPRAPNAPPTRAEVEERLYRTLGRQLAVSDALPERYAETGDAARGALRARVRDEVERLFADQGNDPRQHAPAIAHLADRITALYADEGRGREEIGQMLEDGRLRP